MVPAACTERIAALLGPLGYLDQPEDLALYEYDGGVEKHRPDLVVFPRSTEDVAAIVKIAREFQVPFTGRGAGTAEQTGRGARMGERYPARKHLQPNHVRCGRRRCYPKHRPHPR